MIREEAEKFWPLVKAFSEGKEIQILYKDVWSDVKDPNFVANPCNYRIKPQLKYRPFKDKKECWDEMLKHQPFGWITHGDYENEVVYNLSEIDFKSEFENWTFVDGSPFGVLEEE